MITFTRELITINLNRPLTIEESIDIHLRIIKMMQADITSPNVIYAHPEDEHINYLCLELMRILLAQPQSHVIQINTLNSRGVGAFKERIKKILTDFFSLHPQDS